MNIRRLFISLPLFAAAGSALYASEPDYIKLFHSPEDSTRTKVWWFFGETKTTREGITADLEAFKAAGIGGVVYYDQVHGSGTGADEVFSPHWWESLKFAALEAGRLGLGFEINISDGYVAGGPWISREMSMQRLCSSEVAVRGGGLVNVTLPPPSGDDWFRDVAVLAFPYGDWKDATMGYEADAIAGHSFRSDEPVSFSSITYTAPKARKSRNGAMNIPGGPAEEFYGMMFKPYGSVGDLECSDDGANYRTVCALPRPGGASGTAGRTICFPPTAARFWRVTKDGEPGGAGVEPGYSGTIRDIRLSARPLLDRWQEKANYFSEFHDTPATSCGAINPDSIIDLTDRMREDGCLEWDAPEGEWVIMRIGSESTGGKIKHARAGFSGLECDKMSAEAAELHFRSFAGRIIDTLSLYGLKLDGVTMDSHEAGPQNWTRDFPGLFRQRSGYDITRMLPAMRGYVVGSLERTESFLKDVRQTIASAVASEYYGTLDSLCRSRGVTLTAQASGNGLSLGVDNISAKKYVQKPQGEFWARDVHGSMDIVDCASAAHLYGKPVASAEAFTDAKFSQSPAYLKQLADFAYSRQINEFVVCASAYQPELGPVPGNVAGGRQYCLNRNNTYWPLMRPFWDYQARCAGMMRLGVPVVDILVYLGDDAPLKTLSHLLPVLPEGYNYDTADLDALKVAELVALKPADAGVNPEVAASADDAAVLSFPGGQTYRMLVIQRNVVLSFEEEAIIGSWEAAGLPVYRVSGIYDEVPVPFDRDMSFRSAGRIDDCVRFSHRRLSDADLYFVYNHGSKPFAGCVAYRCGYSKAYLMDPVSGKVLPCRRDTLSLRPDQSAFILLTDREMDCGILAHPCPTDPSAMQFDAASDHDNAGDTINIGRGWTVRFDPSTGGPSELVKVDSLIDWTSSEDVRVRYFSGKAVYENSFTSDHLPDGPCCLEITRPGDIARVSINGKVAGTIWCSPWLLDISSFIRTGENAISIEVVNSLYNRMTGDAQPDCARKWTGSSYPLVTADTELVPSGISSPVRLLFCH